VSLKIVDGHGHEVPVAVTGEVLAKGPGMMRGYLNQPQATRETLVDGWLRTGDLARVDERGFLYFVGRTKDIIRRSGENVAATEVENVLKLHPKIMDAAVIAVPDEIRGEEIKAYVILVKGESPDTVPPEEISSFCSAKLAAYKVPRYLEYRTEDFPRTASMRVQKELLRSERADLVAGVWDRTATRRSAGRSA
jgi:crotonobetaine/carnitine-CoA ligase